MPLMTTYLDQRTTSVLIICSEQRSIIAREIHVGTSDIQWNLSKIELELNLSLSISVNSCGLKNIEWKLLQNYM